MREFNRTLGISISSVAIGIALSSAVQAATLVAGPIVNLNGFANNQVYCQVVNTRTTPVTVTVEAQDEAGLPQTSLTLTLAPDQGASIAGGNNSGLCTFFAPTKGRIAAMLLVYDPLSGNYTGAISAR